MTEKPDNKIEEQWIGPICDGKVFGFIDWNGKWVLQVDCDDLGHFQEGLAAFRRDGKIGFINPAGAEVIKPHFKTQAIVPPCFREGLAPVESDEGSTYINTSGEIVFPPMRNCTLWNFLEDKALLATNGRFAIIDRDWNEVSILDVRDIPFHFNFPENWNCFSCIAGGGDGCQTYINWKGELLFPPIYPYLGHFLDGIAPFSADGNFYGLVKKTGEIFLQPKFLNLYSFSEGLAAAQIERRSWGFINPNGDWAIQPGFLQALPFSEGLACVTVKGNDRRGVKGFIDPTGEMIISPRYHRQSSFHNGWAMVEFEKRNQIIDKKGNVIWEEGIISDSTP